MNEKQNNAGKLVKVSQNGLLSLVAERLKDRVLFPEKQEKAKKDLKKVEVVK